MSPLHAEADTPPPKGLGAFPSYRSPSPFGSTDIERIQQTKVFLQSAGARPWSLGACLNILVKPNEKQDGIRNEPRLARLPEGITFHNLRHTYASWLVIAGVDFYRVKELLGHKSIESTMRYSHLAPHNIKGDVERVFG